MLGDTSISNPVAAHVSNSLGLQHICLDQLAHDRAQDRDFPFHEVIKTCLDNGFSLPAYLACEMIGNEIRRIGDQQWIIISGFPNDIEQLEWFERYVSTKRPLF